MSLSTVDIYTNNAEDETRVPEESAGHVLSVCEDVFKFECIDYDGKTGFYSGVFTPTDREGTAALSGLYHILKTVSYDNGRLFNLQNTRGEPATPYLVKTLSWNKVGVVITQASPVAEIPSKLHGGIIVTVGSIKLINCNELNPSDILADLHTIGQTIESERY